MTLRDTQMLQTPCIAQAGSHLLSPNDAIHGVLSKALVGLLFNFWQASKRVFVKSSVHRVIVCLAKVHLLLTYLYVITIHIHTCTAVENLCFLPFYIVGCETALTNDLPIIYGEEVGVCLVEEDDFCWTINHWFVEALQFGNTKTIWNTGLNRLVLLLSEAPVAYSTGRLCSLSLNSARKSAQNCWIFPSGRLLVRICSKYLGSRSWRLS